MRVHAPAEIRTAALTGLITMTLSLTLGAIGVFAPPSVTGANPTNGSHADAPR